MLDTRHSDFTPAPQPAARDTVDQDFAQNRQRFLAEQGYSYTILDASSLVE